MRLSNIKFQWQPFQAKKKRSIAKTVALNYISPKVYGIAHHTQIFTVTSTTNATEENRKVRNELPDTVTYTKPFNFSQPGYFQILELIHKKYKHN